MTERRNQIVDAAYALLASEGLEGLTIRSVLAHTGLSRRAFYERFATKDDLVLAVFQQTLIDSAQQFSAQIAGLDAPMARLRHIIVGIVMGHVVADDNAEWQSNRRATALSREHLRLAESRPQELQHAIAPLVRLIQQQLEQGMADGSMRRADGERTAMLVYNLVSTTVHSLLIAEQQTSPQLANRIALAEDLWQFCQRAIAV